LRERQRFDSVLTATVRYEPEAAPDLRNKPLFLAVGTPFSFGHGPASVRDEWIRPTFETFGQCCSNKDADPASNDLSSEIAESGTINDIGVQHCLKEFCP
jgi:hypothetical protein